MTQEYIEEALSAAEIARCADALERIATALEQQVLEKIGTHAPNATYADPYPAQLTDEIADLPPVILEPVVRATLTGELADFCPIHHAPWKTVPAGTSKKTGRPYSAFRACSIAGCDQRPRL